MIANRNTLALHSTYETRKDTGFQLVINNASVDFDGTTFQCLAFLDNDYPATHSQTITLKLFRK